LKIKKGIGKKSILFLWALENSPPSHCTKRLCRLVRMPTTIFFVIVFVANTLFAHCFFVFFIDYFFDGKTKNQRAKPTAPNKNLR
jgi:hypothetical protein